MNGTGSGMSSSVKTPTATRIGRVCRSFRCCARSGCRRSRPEGIHAETQRLPLHPCRSAERRSRHWAHAFLWRRDAAWKNGLNRLLGSPALAAPSRPAQPWVLLAGAMSEPPVRRLISLFARGGIPIVFPRANRAHALESC